MDRVVQLLLLRSKLADGDINWDTVRRSRLEKTGYGIWSRIMQSRRTYDLALDAANVLQKGLPKKGGMLRYLPPPFSGWTQSRDMQPLAGETFSRWWKNHRRGSRHDGC